MLVATVLIYEDMKAVAREEEGVPLYTNFTSGKNMARPVTHL